MGDRIRETRRDSRCETGDRKHGTWERRRKKVEEKRETEKGDRRRQTGEGYITYMTYCRTVLRSQRRCEGPTPAPPKIKHKKF